jgi:uncharacterized protein YndB with AHSA1/START domain
MTNGTPASTRLVGSLRVEDGYGIVRMDDLYDTDIDDLWSAITEPERLARWLAKVEGSAQRGSILKATFTSNVDSDLRVDVCEPPKRLLVTAFSEEEGDTVMEAWLTPEGERTRLVIEERGLQVAAVAGHGAGWQAHVEDLAALIAGNPQSDWVTRLRELVPAYRAMFAQLVPSGKAGVHILR